MGEIKEIVILETGKGKVVVAQVRFEYNPDKEPFDQMVERFDNDWTVLRNKVLRRIANHEKLDVRFEE